MGRHGKVEVLHVLVFVIIVIVKSHEGRIVAIVGNFLNEIR
jgi:hypothetical protein